MKHGQRAYSSLAKDSSFGFERRRFPETDQSASRSPSLPDHAFRIGDDGHVSIDQFPDLRAMAFHVIGKSPAPTPDGRVDTLGMGVYALGMLIGDAYLKLMRPAPIGAAEWLGWAKSGMDDDGIEAIADGLLPLSPMAEPVRHAFVCRIDAFLDIALHCPDRLPEIIVRIDALTNERLTERAQAILQIGTDPGASDLWPIDLAGWQT